MPEKTAPDKGSTPEITAIPAKGALPSWTGSVALHIILVALLALLAYSNTFNVPFLFDDFRFISDNPLIKDFDYFTDTSKTEGLNLKDDVLKYFKTRQVGFLSFWASYKLDGLDVRGYHAANLLIHIINSLLVYLMVTLIFRTPLLGGSRIIEKARLLALFSGLLFVAHPMQTEAVTYILQRLVLLATMFYLLTIVLYIGSRLSKRKASKYGLYALALCSAVLAMKTKENTFTLPLTIALCEFIFFRCPTRKRAVLLVPFLITMLIIPLAYMGLNVEDGGIGAAIESATRLEQDMSRWDYLYTQFSVVTSYIRLLLIPVGQNLDHDPAFYQSLFDLPVLLSFLFLMSVLGLGVYLLYRSRITDTAAQIIAFGIFWFFLALSVESSILPIGEMMVEYRVYLPSAGAILALGTGAFLLVGRLKHKETRAFATSSLILIPLVLSYAAYERNNIWKTELGLWEDVVSKSPNKARGHNNLGSAYGSMGLFDKAIEHYTTVLSLEPSYTDVHFNFGIAFFEKGIMEEARRKFDTALRINPDDHEARHYLDRINKTQLK